MANFITKVKINNVEKALDVVGKPLTPIATFDGIGYYHSINVADLDTSKKYDLEGNEFISGTMPEGTPLLQYENSWVQGWIGYYIKASGQLGLSSGVASYVGFTEGAVANVNTSKLDNAYVKFNEGGETATLYFNYAGEGLITGPVSNEELDGAIQTVQTALATKQDILTAGEGINITDNTISALIEKGALKVHDFNKSSISYNELAQAFGDANMGVFLRLNPSTTVATKHPYFFVKSVDKLNDENAYFDITFYELDQSGLFSIRSAFVPSNSDYEKNRDLFEKGKLFYTLPEMPVDNTKTYVLKWESGKNYPTWVEETAS